MNEIITTFLINLERTFNKQFEYFPKNNLGQIRNQFSFNIDKINSKKSKMRKNLMELSTYKITKNEWDTFLIYF